MSKKAFDKIAAGLKEAIAIPKIISRKEAKAQGLKRYFTGKPCKRGHVCERDVKNGQCQECGSIWRKAAYWRDPEKCRARTRDYNRRNSEKVRASSRNYRLRNPEKVRAMLNAWCRKNRDKLRIRRQINKEKIRERNQKLARDKRLALAIVRQLGLEL